MVFFRDGLGELVYGGILHVLTFHQKRDIYYNLHNYLEWNPARKYPNRLPDIIL